MIAQDSLQRHLAMFRQNEFKSKPAQRSNLREHKRDLQNSFVSTLMNDAVLVGWKEWAGLPMLNTPLIKVKIDTGAKTSALHAYDLEIIEVHGKQYAQFFIHPLQKNDIISRQALAEIIDKRIVRSSNGYKEERFVIRSEIKIGNYAWEIDITLTNRDIMNHRMLLGREAMNQILVSPSKTYCQGKVSLKKAKFFYEKGKE